MVAPFNVVTICEAFVYELLSESATVLAQIASDTDRIRPRYAPPGEVEAELNERHVVHTFAGPDDGEPAVPFGSGLGQFLVNWDVTCWEPGPSLQAIEPLAKAIMGELAGPQVRGKVFRYQHTDLAVWDITVWYLGPQLVPPDVGPTEWNRLSDRYRIALRPAA